jgi:RNA polymerase sigma-70 factor (ECF subfamily)
LGGSGIRYLLSGRAGDAVPSSVSRQIVANSGERKLGPQFRRSTPELQNEASRPPYNHRRSCNLRSFQGGATSMRGGELESKSAPHETSGEADEGSCPGPSDDLFPLVYSELREIAGRLFCRESSGHTLQPTALVHEAYLKLVTQRRANVKSRTHFIALGAQAMRRLLVDHARKRGAVKRGSARPKIDLSNVLEPASQLDLDLDQILGVHDAVERLGQFDQRQALIVTLRFFGGLTVEEVAEVIGVSMGTVARDWRHARAWLQVEIARK